MIYLDNAATTYPKPRRVLEEVSRALSLYGGNPGRGAHPLALAAAEKIYACREALAAFLGNGAPERILFLQNTTHALNLAIKGLLRPGDHVLISRLEHNAVRRPVCRLAEMGLTFDTFPVLGLSPAALVKGLEAGCRPNTKAVICTHASNICSVTLPLAEIGRFCRQKQIKFIVDGAQSAGRLPIDMEKMQIDALALPGHKSLYGIQGCGVLALGKDALPTPLWEGGSGVDSLPSQMPEEPPERYEAGTLPTPAIGGLLEGVRWLQEIGIAEVAAHEASLFAAAKERLLALPDITVYQPKAMGAVLLFNKKNVPAADVSNRLAKAGICVRAGLHCAPLAHQALGTPPGGGVRVSFGYFNTIAHVDALWKALKD